MKIADLAILTRSLERLVSWDSPCNFFRRPSDTLQVFFSAVFGRSLSVSIFYAVVHDLFRRLKVSPRLGTSSHSVILGLPYAAERKRDTEMLWTIFAILLVLWLLGSGAGSFVHSLLALAVGVLLIRIIEGRRPALGRKRRRFSS
jgi:hypothetical protein